MKTTRAKAKLAGEKHYFTGNPCKHGHIYKRLTVDGNCCECSRLKNHSEHKKEYLALWISNNKDKVKNIKQKWQDNNKAFRTKGRHKRNTAVKLRTPKWLSKQQKNEMNEFYKMAEKLETVFPWKQHIDHIVPLQGERVSGLNVPWNLQILSASMNIEKGNKFNG